MCRYYKIQLPVQHAVQAYLLWLSEPCSLVLDLHGKIACLENLPSSQLCLAEGFERKSKANFDCCLAAIDGLLVWTDRPTPADCILAKCGPKKFCADKKRNLA